MPDRAQLMLAQCMNAIPENRRIEFQMAAQAQQKSRTVALVLALLLPGIDRIYIGQVGLGVLKICTCGGLGFWAIIDWFLIMGATDDTNITAIMQLRNAYPSAPAQGSGS